MVVITALSSILNLFIPLGVASSIILFAGGLLLFVRYHPFQGMRVDRYPTGVWVLLALIFLTVLEIATHRPSVSDTALYHAQTIRWFESYPAVAGLGNLHHRLAFNSSWLVLHAAFSLAFLGLRSFHLVNSFFILIVLSYFLGGIKDLSRGTASWSVFCKILFIPLTFYLFSSVVSSPAYDLPVSLLIWLIVILWMEMIERDSGFNAYSLVIFILSVYALTIKLSALPLAGFAAWLIIAQVREKNWRRTAALFAMASLILIPWMARSVILSGYLVFPVSAIDLFSPDWKIPVGQVEDVKNGVVGFARLPGKNWQSALTMPFSEWVPIWFKDLTSNQQGILLFALLSPVLLWLMRFLNFKITRYQIFGFFVLYVGILFWFFSAPDIRFGYGFLVGACLLALSLFASILLKNTNASIRSTGFVVLLVLFQAYSLFYSVDAATLKDRILFPKDYSASRAEPCDIKNGTVYCRVEGGQCNYELFPCIPSPRPNVEMRGETFSDGFRVIP